MVKITNQNAGLLTNTEVMQVLQDRGVGDTLRGRALPSEKMLFMYLQDNTPSGEKSTPQLLEFTKEMAAYNLSRAELLQIINLVPSSVVEVHLIVEDCEDRLSEEQVEEILAVVQRLLSVK